MAVTASVVGVALAVGSTAYSVDQSNKQRKQATDLANKQQDRQLKLEAEAKEKGLQTQRNKARDVQASMRSRATAGNSINPDIRTSPSGLDANAPFGGAKTLLGM